MVGVLPDAAHSQRPLADVARIAVGSFGAALVAVGALISFYGYLSAKILGMPRVTFALAEQGDFPRAFAAIHPALSARLMFRFWCLPRWFGHLRSSENSSGMSHSPPLRACSTTAYVAPRFRCFDESIRPARCFRLPAGNFFAGLAVVMCVALVTRVDFGQSLILLATVAVGFLNWMLVRNRTPLDQA